MNKDNLIPLVVAVTGHRDLFLENKDAETALRKSIQEELVKIEKIATNDVPLMLLTALAEGADQIVAEEAFERKWGVIAVLPMPLEDYREDFKSVEALNKFDALYNKCDYKKGLPWHDEDKLDPDITKKEDQQYRNQSVFITRYSQLVIALWDGTPAPEKGACGTSHVVLLCGAGLPPISGELYMHEKTSLIHVPVKRKSNPNIIPEKTKDDTAEFKAFADKFSTFNKDDFKKPAGFDFNNETVEVFKSDLDMGSKSIANAFLKADKVSFNAQTRRKKFIFWIYACLLIAAAFKAVRDVNKYDMLLWGYGIFLALALALFLWNFKHKKLLDKTYFECRVLAEALRIQLFWRFSEVEEHVADYYMRSSKPEIGWIREATRNIAFLADLKEKAERDFEFVKVRWVSGQENYYIGIDQNDTGVIQGKVKQCKNAVKWLELGMWISLGVGFILSVPLNVVIGCLNVVIGCLVEFSNYPMPKNVYLWAPISNATTLWILALSTPLILVAALIKSYIGVMGYKTQASTYERSGQFFRLANKSLCEAPNKSSATLFELGKHALDEHADWLLLHLRNPVEAPTS